VGEDSRDPKASAIASWMRTIVGSVACISKGQSDVSLLDEVRIPLLSEARQSPNLLSDLAGLEQYVAESYDARSFTELLQNADDAGANRFFVGRHGDCLCVANDGHCFSREEFESLCRSAASNKTRASSIGYRGIGFKSVVSFAEKVYVVSGGQDVVFCRTQTRQELPGAKRVLLVRIPHQPTSEDRKALDNAQSLLADGYKAVFVFSDLVGHAIETEFGAFDATSPLFLRHVRQVTLRTRVQTVITLRREERERGERRRVGRPRSTQAAIDGHCAGGKRNCDPQAAGKHAAFGENPWTQTHSDCPGKQRFRKSA
jgi:hypothetical protein